MFDHPRVTRALEWLGLRLPPDNDSLPDLPEPVDTPYWRDFTVLLLTCLSLACACWALAILTGSAGGP